MNGVLPKGREFIDAETGQGYRLTADLREGDILKAEQFEPINGSPRPTAGKIIPLWLMGQLKDAFLA